jgi:N-hydroxyarylamine O-acetyltransferase
MQHRLDLPAYLERIAFAGAPRADIASLNRLAANHAAEIAFENLNPLLGLPIPLDLAAVEDKLVRQRRGGYCFEHNRLLAAALREIGFEVTELAARVLWNQPEDAVTARSHMLLRVDLDGAAWIVDVGFGGLTLTGALRLQPDIAQATPHERFRLVESSGDWRMQAQLRDEWKTLYRFDLHPQLAIDYEAANYYLSTSPASHFTTGLVVARAAPLCRLALRNTEFTRHPLGGEPQRRTLTSADEIIQLLEREFLIALPPHPQLAARLAALIR